MYSSGSYILYRVCGVCRRFLRAGFRRAESAAGIKSDLAVEDSFNALGLVGIFMFLASFPICMLDTGFFGSLKAKTQVKAAQVKDKAGIVWFFGLLAVSMIFSAVCYVFIMRHLYSVTTSVFPQTGPLCIGVWSACCGAFTLILIILYQQLYGKNTMYHFGTLVLCFRSNRSGKRFCLQSS